MTHPMDMLRLVGRSLSTRSATALAAIPFAAIPFAAIPFAAVAFVVGSAGVAHAWDPFISPNPNVEDGNQALQEGDHQGALEAYGRAARELPEEPGIDLNRGLALLAGGQHADARQAFLSASEPGAPDEIRADAFYNAGLSFYHEGDQAAAAEDHQTAQGHFREAVESFRRALRSRPGWQEAAWNLELALRRLREEEQAQEEQERQEQEEQEQNQDQQGDEDQDNNQQDQGSDGEDQEDGENGDEEQQNSDPEQEADSSEQDPQPSQEGDEGNDDPSEDPEPQGNEDDPNRDQNESSQDSQEGGGGEQPQDPPESGGQEIPDNVARVLDALQNSEENLERYRARARARRENRRPTKDW